ncbi:MAG: choice-of-anchor tandem repeat GloVer-containing protein [Bryobacteraceae bacterium]
MIYGTTEYGGSAASDSACPGSYYVYPGCGIVFQLTPPSTSGGAWTETVLHSFSGKNGDGAIPVAGLVLSSGGVLYGTTSAGGTAGKGTAFALQP